MEIVKKEHQPPALRQPENGELQTALETVLIRKATVEQIKEVLRLVMIKIGLRAQNWPTDEEKLVLIEHIVNNFGGHTVSEVKLAFEMAIAGKLETEANCFENFSCLYFSNIMNAYREWAKEEIRHLPKKEQQKLLQESYEKMTDDEYIEMNYRTWQVLKNYGIISVRCYGILVAQKKINLTQEQKDEMYTTQENLLKLKMANDKTWHEQLFPYYQNKEHWQAKVFNECKKKAVEQYFKSLENND